MSQVRRWLVVALVAAAAFALGSCNTFVLWFGEASTSPQADLMRTWTIESNTCSECSSYSKISFASDNTFTILDEANAVIEQNDITDLDDDSFQGHINVQTLFPELVGGGAYAEYEIRIGADVVVLRIDFYEDSTKAVRFVRLVASHELVYKGD